MLPSPNKSPSISKLIKFYDIPVEFTDNLTLIYDEDTELEASVLERALIALKGVFVKSVSIYDFSFLENPYTETLKNVVIFVNDENKSKLILDNTWALNNAGYLFTCNNKIKAKGNIQVFTFSDELCEVNLALSLLKKVVSKYSNERGKRLLEEINDLTSLDSWLLEKLKDIDFNTEIFLSPVFFPALGIMRKLLNKEIKRFYDLASSNNLTFITTGVDYIVVRKREFELRSSKSVKEVMIDVDPLIAPIYLILLTYLFKQVKGG